MAAPTPDPSLPLRWQCIPTAREINNAVAAEYGRTGTDRLRYPTLNAFVDAMVRALVPVVPEPFTIVEKITYAHADACRVLAGAANDQSDDATLCTYIGHFNVAITQLDTWFHTIARTAVVPPPPVERAILSAEARLGWWVDTPERRARPLAIKWAANAFRLAGIVDGDHRTIIPAAVAHTMARIPNTRAFVRAVMCKLAERSAYRFEVGTSDLVAWIDVYIGHRVLVERSGVIDLIVQRGGGRDVANAVAAFLPGVRMSDDPPHFAQRRNHAIRLTTDRINHSAGSIVNRARCE
jgi:hypothetical protein